MAHPGNSSRSTTAARRGPSAGTEADASDHTMAGGNSSSTYGTVAAQGVNGSADAADQERAPLLWGNGKPSSSAGEGGPGFTKRFKRHMNRNVSKKWADLALLACYPITGLLDSSSVFIWGSFLSMQTGNTVYVGLGVVAPTESNRWIRSGTSILAFCLGSAFFARYHRYFGGRKRWVLVSSYILQLLLIIVAALMVTLGPETGTSGPVTVWIAMPIALIAFQSGGQAVVSRVLQFGALTSVVLTSIYCDLFSDAQLFAPITQNAERNRRAAAPLLLLIGAMIGGVWAHSEIGLAGALWTAVVLKALVIVTWCFWAEEPSEEDR